MMRAALLATGLLSLGLLWTGPLPDLARRLFSAHMAMHMGVVAIAAPLMALAVAGGRFDPVHKAPALFSPILASMFELAVVSAWHTPALHSVARHTSVGTFFEQGSFLAAGLLIWLAAFGGTARSTRRAAAGIVGLLLTSMHMTLIGALLALAPRTLYPHARGLSDPMGDGPLASAALCGPPGAIFEAATGWSPLDDQHLGGAIMLFVGGVAYLAGGVSLTAILVHEKTSQAGELA